MEELYRKCLKYPSKINDLSEADLKEFRDWLLYEKLGEIEKLASDMHDTEVKILDRVNMLGTWMHDNAMDEVKELSKKKKGKVNSVLEKVEKRLKEIESHDSIPEHIKRTIQEVALEVSKNSPTNDRETIAGALELYYSTDLNGEQVAEERGVKPNTFSTWKTKVEAKL